MIRKTQMARMSAVLLAVPLGVALLPGAAQARINVHCAGNNSSHLGVGPAFDAGIRQVDPIVAHGSPTSMHEHQFFGSLYNFTAPNPENATYNDYLGTTTSCNILKDTASYWVPTLRYKGTNQLVPTTRMEAYYQSWDNRPTDPSKQTQAFPPDARIVAGNPDAQSRADANINVIAWSCGFFSTKSEASGFRAFTPEDANCATAQSKNPPRESRFLTLTVQFPTCWSGRLNDHTVAGNTADFVGKPGATNNQFAYTVNGKCPTGFPVKVMKLRFTQSWEYRGTGKDVYLSSGMGAAAGQGFTMHADFWNTWDQQFLQKSLAECINTTLPDSDLHTSQPGQCGIKISG